jgi:hypothetical protein
LHGEPLAQLADQVVFALQLEPGLSNRRFGVGLGCGDQRGGEFGRTPFDMAFMRTTTWRMPRDPLGRIMLDALATAWERRSVPVTARPEKAAAIWRNRRRDSTSQR